MEKKGGWKDEENPRTKQSKAAKKSQKKKNTAPTPMKSISDNKEVKSLNQQHLIMMNSRKGERNSS